MLFQQDDFFNLYQEPTVDLSQRKDFVYAHAKTNRVSHVPNTLCTWLNQFSGQDGFGFRMFQIQHRIEAAHTYFQSTQGFLHRLLLVTANSHHLTHGFHLGGQAVVGAREFFEVKAWDFGNHIIDCWLKRGRCFTARDVVSQFIQGVTNGQLGGHFGNRETGCF